MVSDVEEHKNQTDVVTLMTVHSAKGLEFNNVFIIGLEEGIFPHSMSLYSSDDIEEERRLCYVAVTRAKRLCYLTYPRKKMMPWGDIKSQYPSRYIKNII